MTILDSERSLRLIWFGQSVISDWNNPITTTVRATMRALQDAGHMVSFLEARNSVPFVSALATRGWAPYRDFQTSFPDLHYRTYDMPRRAERDVWLSREAALVDAVIVQSDAPVEIFEWLERLDDAPMLRILIKQAPEFSVPETFDVVLTPDSAIDDYRFEPAVLPSISNVASERRGMLIAMYTGGDLDSVRAQWPNDALETIAVGASAPADLPYVSESVIVDRYRQAARVVVVDDGGSWYTPARSMLAVGEGAETWRLTAEGGLESVDAFADAREQMLRLVRMIEARRPPAKYARPPGE